MVDLTGKVAIVTGASRGIGEAAARELAAVGSSVVLTARSTGDIGRIADEINANGGTALAITCDVADYHDVSKAVEQCLSRFGRVDMLVNNAGVIDPISHLGVSDPAAWGQVVDINLKGVYHGFRALIPVMQTQASGVIVNISSGAAVSALEGWSHYCATKAAVLSLTRCADKEYRDKGIRVVGLSPGTVATDMQVSIKASGVNPVSQLDPSAHIPPAWVGRAIAWLCSNEASDLIGEDVSLRDENIRKRIGLS